MKRVYTSNDIKISKLINYKIEKDFINSIIRKLRESYSTFVFTDNEQFYIDLLLDIYNIVNEVVEEDGFYEYYAKKWFWIEWNYLIKNNYSIKEHFEESILSEVGIFNILFRVNDNLYYQIFKNVLDDLKGITFCVEDEYNFLNKINWVV